MKSILFYWSKGAEMRVKILNEIYKCNRENKGCFLSELAKKFGISHVALKKHLDLMIEEGYVEEINPNGKPVFVKLTEKGTKTLKEFKNHK